MALAVFRNVRKLTSALTNISGRAAYAAKKEKTEAEKDQEWAQKEHSAIEKWKFNQAGYHQYGLLHDDLYNELEWDVEEAIRRLPLKVKQERDYRMLRAVQAEMQNQILPPELWSKIEDNHHYLEPYVQEVKREREEIEDWEKTH